MAKKSIKGGNKLVNVYGSGIQARSFARFGEVASMVTRLPPSRKIPKRVFWNLTLASVLLHGLAKYLRAYPGTGIGPNIARSSAVLNAIASRGISGGNRSKIWLRMPYRDVVMAVDTHTSHQTKKGTL